MVKKLRTEELGRKTVDEYKSTEKIPICIVLDNIRSMNNVGSVFRTSDAFTIEHLFLCGITAHPPHREIEKTALGSTSSVDWEHIPETSVAIEKLKKNGYTILGIEQVELSISLSDFSPELNKKYALVFGNEVEGVQQEVLDQCDHIIEIPQFGTKHSFNISVSAGIVLWDLYSKLNSLRS